jgi:hypothetical protein
MLHLPRCELASTGTHTIVLRKYILYSMVIYNYSCNMDYGVRIPTVQVLYVLDQIYSSENGRTSTLVRSSVSSLRTHIPPSHK